MDNLFIAGLIAIALSFNAALAALFFKKGADQLSLSPSRLMRNYHLIAGAFLYLAPTPLYLYALSLAPLSLIYPITSLTYAWVALASAKVLKENITKYTWTGVFLIIMGVSIIAILG